MTAPFTFTPVSRLDTHRPTAGVHAGGRAVGVYVAPLPDPLRERLVWLTGDGVPVTADVLFTKPLPTIAFDDPAELQRLVRRLAAMRMPALFRLDELDERRSPDNGD
ncbi:hypothetical protein ACIU1J_32220 [Azospirillum doebereinerae]|uniref:hypothetical protein n=1 Tax=Azospirillum doebereinerae TaxID=92933 RepID=UPI001EE5B440|nr:hypothetical protein [Azospirillum doebereinerae]MCG5238392.1 hypothetical protein [Azospirillum doebereinerae]